MLFLKLFLVPLFLGIISLAGKYLGPNFAGWLAGLPVIVGPILLLVAIDQGPLFAGASAVFTLATVGAVMGFAVGYAASRPAKASARVMAGRAAFLASVEPVVNQQRSPVTSRQTTRTVP